MAPLMIGTSNVTSSACRGRSLARVLAKHHPAAPAVVRMLIAYGALLYVTPGLWHVPEQPANFPLASPVLPYLRILHPGRCLRW